MSPYQYVTLRCVPRVEREEFVNVGVVLFSEQDDFLDVAWQVDTERISALSPGFDCAAVAAGLRFTEAVCAADPRVGEIAGKPPGVRFGFLKAPRSTVLQSSGVHGGITSDPAAELSRLLDKLVR